MLHDTQGSPRHTHQTIWHFRPEPERATSCPLANFIASALQFWNVRLAPSAPTDAMPEEVVDAPSDSRRSMVREAEEKMEQKVFRIWSVLSTFEESSAACISDMLLHVSNGAYIDGVFVAERFIWHVEILFGCTDNLDIRLATVAPKGTWWTIRLFVDVSYN